jgi:hypothetical protein
MNKDKWHWQVKSCSHIRSSQSINDVKMDVLVILIPAQTLAFRNLGLKAASLDAVQVSNYSVDLRLVLAKGSSPINY